MEKYRNEFQGFYDEGKTEGKAEAILDVLLDRGIAVPKEVREQVLVTVQGGTPLVVSGGPQGRSRTTPPGLRRRPGPPLSPNGIILVAEPP
jgi:hypothetical protein